MRPSADFFKISSTIYDRFNNVVNPDDGVAPVGGEYELALQPRDTLHQVVLHLVIDSLENHFPLGTLHDVTDVLPLGGPHLVLKLRKRLFPVPRRLLTLDHIRSFPYNVRVQAAKHTSPAFLHLANIFAHHIHELSTRM